MLGGNSPAFCLPFDFYGKLTVDCFITKNIPSHTHVLLNVESIFNAKLFSFEKSSFAYKFIKVPLKFVCGLQKILPWARSWTTLD